MFGNCSNVVKDINLQIEEAENSPNRININKTISRYIIVNFLKSKDKEKIMKAAREKHALQIGERTV